MFLDQCQNKIGGGVCGHMLARRLIKCYNKKDIGEQFQHKCPFSCQSCQNPGKKYISFDKYLESDKNLTDERTLIYISIYIYMIQLTTFLNLKR